MEQTDYRAYICCGPNCGPKGSVQLLTVLEEEVQRQGMSSRVAVLPTGCQSHCETGPTMVVYPGPVYYQEVDGERLARIVREHFGRGTPVQEYFWVGPYPKRLQVFDRDSNAARVPKLQADGASGEPDRKPKERRVTPDVDDFKW
ncbi:MAG: (2Fe-2S) ferredoxin domain-containing protein [Chloroflexota bacterium]|nr:(2Fe-2S) ferredoxin domain-containing protein [Chloroflexota bacterium]MDQ5867217.1 (2Fe-2S) ferredoxin domain-containing protein [Chloroflexota bacterium]